MYHLCTTPMLWLHAGITRSVYPYFILNCLHIVVQMLTVTVLFVLQFVLLFGHVWYSYSFNAY